MTISVVALALLLDGCASLESGINHQDPPPVRSYTPDTPDTPDTSDTSDTSDDTGVPEPTVETFMYRRPRVDVLFVIDNSSSMGGKNDALAEGIAPTIASWRARDIDYHAGVVDIDVNDWQGTLEDKDGVRWVDDTLVDPEATLTRLLRGVPDEVSVEAGRRAVWRALQLCSDGLPNAGFLRGGAELAIVIQSDEDDSLPDDPPLDTFLAYLQALRPEPELLHFHSISGGAAYTEVTDVIGGVTWRVNDTPYEPAFEAITDTFHRTNRFGLMDVPDPATLTVSVAGVPLAAAVYRYDADANRVDLAGVPLLEGDEVTLSYLPLVPAP